MKLLPLGTVVYLVGGNQKMFIVGRGTLVEQDDHEVRFDYTGVRYPDGLLAEEVYYFNEEDIDSILSEGYRDDEDERYVTLYNQWLEEKGKDIPKGKTSKI